jgi:prepilin-type N-terminal cleavage/methylation domain-containing protein
MSEKYMNENRRKYIAALAQLRSHSSNHLSIQGLTLTELVVVIAIVSLLMLLALVNLFGAFRKGTFRGQVQDLVSTMQMAASAAAESDRRYEVIIDIIEQAYTLREITSPDLKEVLEEEVIVYNQFNENCRFEYVLFDDLVETDEDHQIAKFRAGRAGWQNGGKIVLYDQDEQPYSIVVNRINGMVVLERGDVGILMPRAKDELPF